VSMLKNRNAVETNEPNLRKMAISTFFQRFCLSSSSVWSQGTVVGCHLSFSDTMPCSSMLCKLSFPMQQATKSTGLMFFKSALCSKKNSTELA
jgi:hypothetical protein